MSGEVRCDAHKGHRTFIGGVMDGQVDHLIYAAPSDFPPTIGTLKRGGQRSQYRLDSEATVGTEAVYRHAGFSS